MADARGLLASLSVDDFIPHLGQPFALSEVGDAAGSLVLTAAEAARHTAAGRRAGFSLVFSGGAVMTQGLHTLVHPTFGPLELFLVPLGPGERGLQYEAVFN